MLLAALATASKWRALKSESLDLIRHCLADAHCVIASARDCIRLRSLTKGVAATVQGKTEDADATGKDITLSSRSEPPPDTGALEIHGRLIGLTAHELLTTQAAALNALALAARQDRLVQELGTRARERAVVLSEAMPAARQVPRLARLPGSAVAERLRPMFAACLEGAPALRVELRAAISSTAPTILRLVHFQGLLLALGETLDKCGFNSASRFSMALEMQEQVTDLMRVHLSSLVTLLSLAGVRLRQDVDAVVRSAQMRSLFGAPNRGKRTTLNRLNRLPAGQLVRIKGRIVEVEEVGSGAERRVELSLQDLENEDRARVVIQNSSGLKWFRTGSHVALSGIYLKQEPSGASGACILVPGRAQTLDDEVGAAWKEEFLLLSSKYFPILPSGVHAVLELPATTSKMDGNSDSPLGTPCEDQWEEYFQACQDYDIAHAEAMDAVLMYSLEYAGVLVGIVVTTIATGGGALVVWGIAAGTAGVAISTHGLVTTKKKLAQAKERMEKAKQEWTLCCQNAVGDVGGPPDWNPSTDLMPDFDLDWDLGGGSGVGNSLSLSPSPISPWSWPPPSPSPVSGSSIS